MAFISIDKFKKHTNKTTQRKWSGDLTVWSITGSMLVTNLNNLTTVVKQVNDFGIVFYILVSKKNLTCVKIVLIFLIEFSFKHT